MLGIVVLAVVPFLAGSARNQDAQLRSADLTQTAVIGTTTVALKPCALQPGVVDFEIGLPTSFTDRVSLVFASPDRGVPPTEVAATALGNGRFRAFGLFTPIVGQWRVQVYVGDRNAAQSATFALPTKSQPIAPQLIDISTLALGLLEVVGVVGRLLFASWLSATLSAVPLAEHVVLVSGRSSYEIMQKCLAEGVPVVRAVSAPRRSRCLWRGNSA